MTRKYLDSVYDHIGKGVAEFYDDWAATYEAEVAENGYVTPARCARALAAHVADKTTPILDFGCGTGLSGHALRAQGFTVIDGVDLSAAMLEQARSKGIYRTLTQVTPDTPMAAPPGSYPIIAAIGVIGPGAAPLEVFDTLFDHLPKGGHMVLSFNDHALQDPAYEGQIDRGIADRQMHVTFREHGPHLPARNINSTVYILEKL
ncbi:class I SAM-dependent DNA methyltransferase [Shimia biformata]|uniref:class I SAM-dependent DNA methyltransferase n=1 Tax=Shimia biformata TaxID=1294299 RepID=UPI001951BB31|nr:methyltransferase domain-containing protein [Shimia biformata]